MKNLTTCKDVVSSGPLWLAVYGDKNTMLLEVVEDGNEKFAYDNPYFQEDDGEKKNAILRNGNLCRCFFSSFLPICPQQITYFPIFHHNDGSEKSDKLKNGKVGPFSNLVFTNPGNKPKTMDDSFISLEPEIVNVPLRGHDFSGLGFNITGNMRDGIFVKDVLHRGPASESGQLKIGDRILSVTVSFSSMVYEDALTILSYASPYDVSLELKKAGRSNLAGHEKKASMSSNDIMTVGNGLSGSSDRLYHPLYRSKSIDDLTQIGKDQLTGGLAMNGGIPPRRSLSIGTPVHRLKREKMQNREKPQDKIENTIPIIKPTADETSKASLGSSNSSISSKSSKSSEKKPSEEGVNIVASDIVITMDKEDEKKQTKEQDETSVIEITGDPDKSSVIVKTASESDIVETINGTAIDIRSKDETNISIPEPDEVVIIIDKEIFEQPDKKNKKKGKAPPPPPSSIPPAEEADVKEKRPSSRSSSSSSSSDEEPSFKDAQDVSTIEDASLITALDVSFDPDSLEKTDYQPTVSTLSRSSSNVSDDSLEGTDSLKRKNSKKSSSLGDISKAEGISGTDSLERATSLDLRKDPVPEGNIGEQNKHLKRRAPNPPSSSSSSDDTLPSEQQLSTLDSIEPAEDLVYKASVIDVVVDEDSLERVSLKDEDIADPDSLETESEQRSRKSSTSSASSVEEQKSVQETPEEQDETIIKVKVSVPSSILDKLDDKFSSPSSDEEKNSEKEDSNNEEPIKVELSRKSSSSSISSKKSEESPKLSRKSSTSSKSSSSDKENEPIKIELSRKNSTSSTSSKSSEDEPTLTRKSSTSSVSSVEVEETIVKITKVVVKAEFFPLNDSENEDTENDPEPQPQKKVVSAEDLNLDMNNTSSDSEPSLNEYSVNESPPPPNDEEESLAPPMEPVSEPPEVKVAMRKKSSSDLFPSLNLPVIPPLITTTSKSSTNTQNDNTPKAEVIEITRKELDDVMMTHEQFVKKQASKQNETTPVQSDRDMSFEDWSIMSNKSKETNTVNGNTTYSSSFETNISIDGGSYQPVVIRSYDECEE
ncbi:hypothetical protein GQR58_004658 [Nymphon striatum]|nr:hypothetical protein GQR58_004658 [Nymphon striatum]